MKPLAMVLVLALEAFPMNASAADVDCTAVPAQAYQLARSGADYAIRSIRQRHAIEGRLSTIEGDVGAAPLACALSSLAKEWDDLSASSATEMARGEYQRASGVARSFMAEHGYVIDKVKP